jgi:hypothetical protein
MKTKKMYMVKTMTTKEMWKMKSILYLCPLTARGKREVAGNVITAVLVSLIFSYQITVLL